jgi:microcystin-dependent protein
MATVTANKTWVSGETVTPAGLNLTAAPTVVVADNEVTTAKILDANVTTAKIADGNVTLAKLVTAVQQALLPAGAVQAFAMNSAPAGWLAADGNEYAKTGDYAALFAAISTTYGETNGSGAAGTSHFRVPDLRGIFVRGSGSQTIGGIVYNKTFAAKEGDAFQGHHHSLTNQTLVWRNTGGGALGGGGVSSAANLSVTDPTTDGTNGTPRTATETRPANIALLYCIKF